MLLDFTVMHGVLPPGSLEIHPASGAVTAA
jgi:hypothetical protein